MLKREYCAEWSVPDIRRTGNVAPHSLLEVKLKPGEHTITVVLDDGTDQVEDSFVVVVKEEDESPGPGLVAAIGGRGAGWPRYGPAEG